MVGLVELLGEGFRLLILVFHLIYPIHLTQLIHPLDQSANRILLHHFIPMRQERRSCRFIPHRLRRHSLYHRSITPLVCRCSVAQGQSSVLTVRLLAQYHSMLCGRNRHKRSLLRGGGIRRL